MSDYTKKERDLIEELEKFAAILEKRFDDAVKIDFDDMFSFFNEIQNIQDINDKIMSYAEYLRGVALPFYDEKLTEEKYYEETPELNDVDNARSWCSLVKKDYTKMDVTVYNGLEQHYNRSKYKWALMFGFHHHFLIKKHRTNTHKFND